MDLENTRVFYYVAKHLNFTEASKLLFISQSSISGRITNLEKELNTKLFLRSPKAIVLTEDGKKLFETLNYFYHSIQSIHSDINMATYPLRIGITLENSSHYSNYLINTLENSFLSIDFIYGTHEELVPKLHSGAIDTLLSYRPLSFEKFLVDKTQLLIYKNRHSTLDKTVVLFQSDAIRNLNFEIDKTLTLLNYSIENVSLFTYDTLNNFGSISKNALFATFKYLHDSIAQTYPLEILKEFDISLYLYYSNKLKKTVLNKLQAEFSKRSLNGLD